MNMQLQGILTGRYIELPHELDFPDGQHVTVDIRPETFSPEEKRRLIDELCGSWASDSTLTDIFSEIESERHDNGTRKVNFDAAS
jgi:hypothetical protein